MPETETHCKEFLARVDNDLKRMKLKRDKPIHWRFDALCQARPEALTPTERRLQLLYVNSHVFKAQRKQHNIQ